MSITHKKIASLLIKGSLLHAKSHQFKEGPICRSTESMPQNKIIKVALCLRTCSHYRVPIYRSLNSKPDIRLKVLHGSDIAGTKFVNPNDMSGFESRKLFTIQLPLTSSGRSVILVFFPGLFFVLLRYRPDIIITEGGANLLNNMLVLAYSFLFRKPVVCWTLGRLKGRRYFGTGRLYRTLVVFFERHADALLGYSSVSLSYFKKMGYTGDKCFVAVNCLDTDKIFTDIQSVQAQLPEFRRALGLRNKPVVLYVGAFEKTKAIHRLIHAFVLARQICEDIQMILVGDGPIRAQMEKLSKELQVDDAIRFTGKIIEGVAAYFQIASLFVLPGLGGLAIVEAMTHGLPVICGTCDGTEEDYVIHGETGFRFTAQDDETAIEEIAKYLVLLSKDEKLRQKMATKAKRMITERYNRKTFVDSIYRTLVHVQRKGRWQDFSGRT